MDIVSSFSNPCREMSDSPTGSGSVEASRAFLSAEIRRAQKQLQSEQWSACLVGVGDRGEVSMYPCNLVLPFYYPETIAELDEYGRDHFEFPEAEWRIQWQSIQEFVDQYGQYAAMEDKAQSTDAEVRHRQRRIKVLRDACAAFDPTLTIFGIESDSETWWEVLTFHIFGPRIPSPPEPKSDAQLLARLCRHTHSYVGRSRFGIEDEAITEVSFDAACTTDATIDLRRLLEDASTRDFDYGG
jgi:hypothetical protein